MNTIFWSTLLSFLELPILWLLLHYENDFEKAYFPKTWKKKSYTCEICQSMFSTWMTWKSIRKERNWYAKLDAIPLWNAYKHSKQKLNLNISVTNRNVFKWIRYTNTFKIKRCNCDLCYEMTYFPSCLKVYKCIGIPLYIS